MKRSELEKAAGEWVEKRCKGISNYGGAAIYSRDNVEEFMQAAFEFGAKWALEWALANIECVTVYHDGSRMFLEELLEIKDETETKEK